MDILKHEFFQIYKKKKNLIILIILIILLVFSFQFFDRAGKYAESFKSPPIGDWIHDHLPLMNLNWLVSYGYPLAILFLSLFFILKEPKSLNKFILLMALWMIVRGLFISMTHLGAPSPRIDDITNIPWIHSLDYSQDLFPSGHVAVPFLGFLLAKNRKAKIISLLLSLAMGFGVLAMHVHYSIDVFGGFFIAFGMYYPIQKYLSKYLDPK